jgi:hypothetical protein
MPTATKGHTAREAAEGLVEIALTPAQVERVIEGAKDAGSFTALLTGLDAEGIPFPAVRLNDSRLSRSFLAGLLILSVLPADGTPIGNVEIARALNVNPSTCHRYVQTLVAVGLAERDAATRRYRLPQR